MKYWERRKAALERASERARQLDAYIRTTPGTMFRELRAAFGLPPSVERPKWPRLLHGARTVNGFEFRMTLQSSRSHHPAGHRLFVVCPDCDQLIPVGRYHQHVGTCVDVA